MFCSNCGNKLDDGARFCGECGTPVIAQETVEATEALDNPIKTCKNCGFEIEDGAMFCGECGTPVNEADNISVDSATQTVAIPAIQPENTQPVHKEDLHKGDFRHTVRESSEKEKKSKKEKENYTPLIIALVVVVIACGAALWYTFSKASKPVYVELPDISSIEPDENGETSEEDAANIEKEESMDESEDMGNTIPAEPSYEADTDMAEEYVNEPVADDSSASFVTQAEEGDSYIFPSDEVYITEDFLDTLSKEEIAFIRNEIYARHGYIFQTEPFKSYFSEKSWYVPNENFNESMLSDIEKVNVNTILEYEKRMGWR